jgi:hypothetical protein
MVEAKETVEHVISSVSVEQERAICQKAVIVQYDNRKIDEKKVAIKLKDLRQYSDTAKDAVDKMRELADTA